MIRILTRIYLCTIISHVRTRARSSADRAVVFETKGRGFESLRARLRYSVPPRGVRGSIPRLRYRYYIPRNRYYDHPALRGTPRVRYSAPRFPRS